MLRMRVGLTGAVAVLCACAALGTSTAAAQDGEFVKTQLAGDESSGQPNTLNPMEIEVAPDGTVFYTERRGVVGAWDPETETSSEIGTVPVTTFQENGLLGIALAPDYETSGWIYLSYSALPLESLTQRVSRFQLDASGDLDMASEQPVFEWTHLRETCCHSAGALEFDPAGNLLISTGDNTNPFESQGYAPIDERPGRQSYDAQRTSANTNDHNGKLLRITPADVIMPGTEPGIGDTYEIPAGNMFDESEDTGDQTLPEIHSMGFRNPFRFKVDEETGWSLLADYGPDAGSANPDRGPAGSVEFNVIQEPINSGWPYCIRENVPYIDFDFETNESGEAFDCENPVNDSPNNTGLTDLPPVFPATMWQSFSETDPRYPGLGTNGAPMSGPRYYFDPSNPSPTKFPESFDGKWFIASWNNDWIRTVDLDSEGTPSNVQNFPSLNYLSPMDMEFGPDGALYLAEWGQGFGADHPESGIYRIDHVQATAPQVTASADPTRGTVPLEVAFDGEATNPDGSPNPSFEYEWDFGDGNTSTEPDPTHTYTDTGTYVAELTVTDPDTSEQGSDAVTIRVDPEDSGSCPAGGRSDEFDGEELDTARWSFLHPSTQTAPHVTDGNLVLTLSDFSFDADRPGPASILGQEMPEGDWDVVAKIAAPGLNEDTTGQSQYAKVGLIAFQDNATEPNKHFISYTQVRNADGGGTEQTFFEAGAQNGPAAGDRILGGRVGTAPAEENLAGPFWIRITRTGDAIEGFYSLTDPDTNPNWVPINNGAAANLDIEAIMPANEGPIYIGPYGANGSIETTFDYVRFTPECASDCFGDPFDGASLDKDRWNAIVREDESLYRLQDGTLWVETVEGDIYQTGDGTPTRNFLLQSADHAGEDWTIETKVLAGELSGGYAHGGLMAYEDDSNYIKYDIISDVGNAAVNRIELRSEVNDVIQNPQPQVTPLPAGTEDAWLRLTKTGDMYSGEYSLDGDTWQSVGAAVPNPMIAPSFGIFTQGVQIPGPEVGFEYFALDGEIECAPGNSAPVIAEVSADPTAGVAPLEVDFTAAASDPDGDDLTYEWDFGDGDTSSQQNPTHTYTEAGQFDATVTVSDGEAQRSQSVTVTVLPDDDPEARFRVLAFSKTAAFRHGSIPAGHAALDVLAEDNDFQVDHTEDSAVFTEEILASYDTVAFLSTTGDVLTEAQQDAFEAYIQGGGGYTGIHSASDTEYTWPWYGELVGAYFRNHPPGTPTATVGVEDQDHPSTAGQPDSYSKVDEWYNFQSPIDPVIGGGGDDYSPRPNVHVLATVDESTYDEQDGNATDDDHPIIWCQRYDGGRSWYTGMGHTDASFSEPEFLQQLLGGLETTAGVEPSATCGFEAGADITPPETTHELDPPNPGPGGTYDGPVDVTLSATDPDEPGSSEPETHQVAASGFAWDATEVEATVGDTVEWDFSGASHDVCIDDSPPEWAEGFGDCGDDEVLGDAREGDPGGAKTFTEVGSFGFYCSLHEPAMRGTVNVAEGDAEPVPGSGVDITEYRVNTDGTEGEWQTAENTAADDPFETTFTVADEGSHVVEYRSTDNAGNVEGIKSVEFSIEGDEQCNEHSDEFDEPLDSERWSFLHPTTPTSGQGAPRVEGGSLVLPLGSGELDTTNTGPIGLVGQPMPSGDFELVTQITADIASDDTGPNGYAQAGLMLHQTDDNFIKVTHTRVGQFQPDTEGQSFFEIGAETDGQIARSPQVNVQPDHPSTWWMRLVRTGNQLTAWYTLDDPEQGGTWNEIPLEMNLDTIMPAANGPIQIGAYGGLGSIEASYEYIRFTPDEDCPEPGHCPRSDTFDGTDLDRDRWEVIRENAETLSVSDGALHIESEPFDIFNADTGLPNIVLQPLPGGGEEPWSFTTEMTWDPTQNFQNAGLIIYDDDDNYIKTGMVWNGSRNFELVKETNGAATFPGGSTAAGDLPSTYFMRFVSEDGNSVVSQFSADGESWTDVGTTGTDLSGLESPRIGVYATASTQDLGNPTASFHSVAVEPECGTNEPPVIESVTADPDSGDAPLEVDLTVDASDPDGDDLSYEWDFGDGETSTEEDPTHTYTEPGTYEAEVTVSDGEAQVSDSVTVTVTGGPEPRFRVLAFSETAGFRHTSIDEGHAALDALAAEHDFAVDHTEDSSAFTEANLANYDTVAFLSTTGDVLTEAQQDAFEAYIQSGGGYTGIHSASDTEYTWPWYGDLVGGYFRNHPPGTPTATVRIEDQEHPSTAGQPDSYSKVDEWYNFQSPDNPVVGGGGTDYSPRPNVHVLANVDETTYDEQDGNATDDDHPLIWCQRYDGGRSWYTAMGHTEASFGEAEFLQQLLGGLETTAGVEPSESCGVEPGADITPPETTHELDPPNPGPGGTYDGPVDVTLSATDPGTNASGVEITEYRVNTDGTEGEWQTSENTGGDDPFETTVTVSAEGSHVVEYRSTDVAGNVEDAGTVAFSIAGDVEPGEPDLTARVQPRRETVKLGKQARFELTVRNRGDAAAEDVELCVKAPSRKVKVLGAACRETPTLGKGSSVKAAFRLKPKRSAAGDRINVRFIVTAANADRASDSASLKVEKKKRGRRR